MNEIDELLELYLEQFKNGTREAPEAFAARYPKEQAELLAILPALCAMEEIGSRTVPMSVPAAAYPERLGDFRLIEKIGQGGMGCVFRAVQESLNREVAVKILSPTLAASDEQRQKFANEAKIIARLQHPNIVNVYGAGYEQGYSFYVMELIDGKALDCSYFAGVPERRRKVAEIARQAADALAYAHENHVLHRDFKLANLLLDRNGVAHLSDFGIAAVLSDPAAGLATRTREGTLRYMAPEIFLEDAWSFASDQYSFGVSMYELLHTAPAYADGAPGKMIRDICEKRFPELNPAQSDLAVIINKCTSHAASGRYPSMRAVCDDLTRYLHHEPIRARRVPAWKKLALWARRRPAVAALLLLCAMLLVISFGSILAGYVKVKQSLRREAAQRLRAERNLAIAGNALERIFSRMAGMESYDAFSLTPSPAMVELLNDLLPYYEEAAKQENRLLLPVAPAEIKRRLGMIALRAGKYELAERMFAAVVAASAADSPVAVSGLNSEAQACHLAGKQIEAEKIWLELAEKYEQDGRLAVRLEAVKALRNLAYSAVPYPQRRNVSFESARTAWQYFWRAGTLLESCRKQNPDDPECRFLSAVLMVDYPNMAKRISAGGDADPCGILEKLIAEHPEIVKYQSEMIRAAIRLPREQREPEESRRRIQTALTYAEKLLAVMPFDETLIADTVQLYDRKLAMLVLGREYTEVRRELWRQLGMLKPVAIHPQASDDSREIIVDFLLRKLRVLSRGQSTEDLQSLAAETRSIVAAYRGSKKAEFELALRDL